MILQAHSILFSEKNLLWVDGSFWQEEFIAALLPEGPVFGIGEIVHENLCALLQKMKLFPTREIIRQRSHYQSEQKIRGMMGIFLA
jgi:hypothetical protein